MTENAYFVARRFARNGRRMQGGSHLPHRNALRHGKGRAAQLGSSASADRGSSAHGED